MSAVQLVVAERGSDPKRGKRRLVVYRRLPCASCGTTYLPGRVDQQYCSAVCGRRADKLAHLRGRRIYSMAYHWRANRKAGADQLREMCREIAQWIEEDRRMGRLPPRRFSPKDRGNVLVY
jgi:hypothetical protein